MLPDEAHSGIVGVAGRDAVQVLQELHRIRVARSRQVHRRLALWDETVTLVVLLASFWVLVEAIAVLSQGGGQGSLGKIRFVQMGLMLLAVGVCIATVLWLKVSIMLLHACNLKDLLNWL